MTKLDDALYGHDVRCGSIRLAGVVHDHQRLHLIDDKHYTASQLVAKADELDAQESLELDMPLQLGKR